MKGGQYWAERARLHLTGRSDWARGKISNVCNACPSMVNLYFEGMINDIEEEKERKAESSSAGASRSACETSRWLGPTQRPS